MGQSQNESKEDVVAANLVDLMMIVSMGVGTRTRISTSFGLDEGKADRQRSRSSEGCRERCRDCMD